jgi:hypothetical protein
VMTLAHWQLKESSRKCVDGQISGKRKTYLRQAGGGGIKEASAQLQGA